MSDKNAIVDVQSNSEAVWGIGFTLSKAATSSEVNNFFYVDCSGKLVCLFSYEIRSQSYQTLIFPVFRFLLVSLSVCYIWKKTYQLKNDLAYQQKMEKFFVYEEKQFGRINSCWLRVWTKLNIESKILIYSVVVTWHLLFVKAFFQAKRFINRIPGSGCQTGVHGDRQEP